MEEIIGWNFQNFLDEESKKIVADRYRRRQNGESSPSIYEFGIVRKGGEKRRVEISVTVINDSKGVPQTIAQILDITDKKKLESQLQQAQKMETIGILAGGVAHDLNNILSGIVSYPELILMDLSEDSPLRRPISTIKKSGEQAAIIVQDLLTLARRGVTTTEVVNLNSVIFDQLKSPEFERLKSFHPDAQVETNLERDLLNVKGSITHLSKTVMNLVSNAAEAMPNGGKISISTENLYIDRPLRNHDYIEEGDYVSITVSDTGIGISKEDIDRIFEPFYTKKVMGRSGKSRVISDQWEEKNSCGRRSILWGGGSRFERR
jgi:signal transduction histidine kinase